MKRQALKKGLLLLTSIACIITGFPILASGTDIYYWADGWGTGLSAYTTNRGSEAYATTEEAYNGQYSMKVSNPNGRSDNTRIWNTVRNLIAGEQYTITSMVKIKYSVPDGMGVVLRVTDSYLGGTAAMWARSDYIRTTNSQWKQLSLTFTLPEGLRRACLCLDTSALAGTTSVYWDDIRISGGMLENGDFETVTPAGSGMLFVPDGAAQLMTNGGFESSTGWYPYGGTWSGSYVSLVNSPVRNGGKALKITSDEPAINPFASQMLTVESCTEYILMGYMNCNDLGDRSTVQIKLELYTEPRSVAENVLCNFVTQPLPETGGEWVEFYQFFQTPKGCHGVAIMPRLYSTGTVYFDDLAVYEISEPKTFLLETDAMYYYSDQVTGTATVKSLLDGSNGYTAALKIKKDGTEVFYTEKTTFQDDAVTFTYPISKLGEKQKGYDLEVSVYDPGGTFLKVLEQKIYKYDKPSVLNRDGVYIKGGKPFFPVIAYHVSPSDYSKMAEAGINTVQAHFTKMEELDNMIKKAEENDLMLLVCLYRNGKSAAHPDNIDMTEDAVLKYNTHPIVFAWAVMDEPFSFIPYFDCIRELSEAYKFIRDRDSIHPVYTLDNQFQSFSETAKYVDVFATDPYPGARYCVTEHVSNMVGKAVEAVAGKKPVYPILQAYEESGMFPTGDEMRNMVYQSLFEGAKGIGYFAVSDSRKDSNGANIPLYDTTLWEPLKALSVDLKEAFSAAAVNPVFCEGTDSNVRYRAWANGNKLLIAVVNRSSSNSVDFSVPLQNGDISIENFSGSIIRGGTGTSVGYGVLEGTLPPPAVQLWEITPYDNLQLSQTKLTATDSRGTVMHTLLPGDVRITASFFNERNTADTVFLLTALYDNVNGVKRLIHVETVYLTADTNKTAYYDFNVLVQEEIKGLKAFMWSCRSDTDMRPYASLSLLS